MPITFPSNPSVNQTYAVGDRTWRWDGSSWKVVAVGRAAVAQATAPSNPLVGQMWFDTENGIQYTYFNDGTSSQWVETGWAGQLTNIAAGGGLTGTYPNPTVASISGLSAGGDLSGTYPNPTLAKGPTYVTSLPSSPIDGQEIYYAADATNGVIWHLRYRSGSSSSYKWEFVGGAELTAVESANSTTTSASYTEGTDTTSRVTVPLAGDYLVTGTGAMQTTTASTLMQVSLAAGTSDSQISECRANQAADFRFGYAGAVRFNGAAASTVFSHRMRNGSADGNTIKLLLRRTVVTPVRVG